jgi:hypothetical protein
MQNKIDSLELMDKGVPAFFVLKTMEEIADRQKGIADDPHRHNYYSLIWPFGGSGRHMVDFNEYPILKNLLLFAGQMKEAYASEQELKYETTGAYLKLTYKSTSFKKTGHDEFVMNGDMTIRGTTWPLKIKVLFGGIMVDPWGNTKAGFELSGKINRKEFGLHWNAVTEAVGMILGCPITRFASIKVFSIIWH